MLTVSASLSEFVDYGMASCLFSPLQILSMHRPPYAGTLAAVYGPPSPGVTGTNIAPFLLWYCTTRHKKGEKLCSKALHYGC
jgi:hypothetical protein